MMRVVLPSLGPTLGLPRERTSPQDAPRSIVEVDLAEHRSSPWIDGARRTRHLQSDAPARQLVLPERHGILGVHERRSILAHVGEDAQANRIRTPTRGHDPVERSTQ